MKLANFSRKYIFVQIDLLVQNALFAQSTFMCNVQFSEKCSFVQRSHLADLKRFKCASKIRTKGRNSWVPVAAMNVYEFKSCQERGIGSEN